MRNRISFFPILALSVLLASSSLAQLVGVVGDFGEDPAIDPETLWEINPADATDVAFIMDLGAGGLGEAIAYNPDDDLLYHTSGFCGAVVNDCFWEVIDVSVPSITSSTQMSGSLPPQRVAGLTYDEVGGVFLSVDRSRDLREVTDAGSATAINTNVPEDFAGLAFLGGSLYAVADSSGSIFEMDPSDGSILGSETVVIDGSSGFFELRGLAYGGGSVLWAIWMDDNYEPNLVTLDPATGIGTSKGVLPDDFRGLAFLPEPGSRSFLVPGTFLLGLSRVPRRNLIARP